MPSFNPFGRLKFARKPQEGATGTPEIKGRSRRIPSSQPSLPPPALKNPESLKVTVSRGDFDGDTDPPDRKLPFLPDGVGERALVAEMRKLYDRERGYTAYLRRKWELYERFVAGEQWARIDTEHGIIDGRSSDRDVDDFVVVNVLAPAITKVTSLVTAGLPEVEAIPILRDPEFRKVAEQANKRLGHVKHACKVDRLTARQVRNALICGTAFKYWPWDNDKEEIQPRLDPYTGQPMGFEMEQTGGIDVQMLRAQEVFIDSSAKELGDASFVILAQVTPLSELQTRYGERARRVEPEKNLDSMGSGALPYRSDGSMSLSGTNKVRGEDSVMLLTVLIKPQPNHPQKVYQEGLYACIAGDVLLHSQEWPWVDKDCYPLAPIYYDRVEGSVWGVGLVSRLIDLQIRLNSEYRRIFKQLDLDKAIVTRMEGSGPAATLMQDIRALDEVILINHAMGTSAPTIGRGPQPSEAHFKAIELLVAQMQEIAGLPDVLEGAGAESVESGIMYDLMVKTATSVHRPLVDAIGECDVLFAEGVLREYGAKGPMLSLLSVDPYGNKPGSMQQQPGMPGEQQDMAGGEIVDFTAFNQMSSGEVLPFQVYLSPSSGADMSPDARKNRLMQHFAQGLFGPLESLGSAMRYWELTDEPEAQQVLESLQQEAQMQAEQQQQMVEAEQGQAQAELEGKQQESQMRMAESQQKMQVQAQLGEQKIQLEREKADIELQKAQMDMELKARSTQMDLEAKQVQHQQGMAQSQQQFEMQQAQQSQSFGQEQYQQEAAFEGEEGRTERSHASEQARTEEGHAKASQRESESHQAKMKMEKERMALAIQKAKATAKKPAPATKK